jgi:hypothetical protein
LFSLNRKKTTDSEN